MVGLLTRLIQYLVSSHESQLDNAINQRLRREFSREGYIFCSNPETFNPN
jgi:hypothetical protein